MAGLGDILNLSSVAEQLFLWGVLNQLLSEILTPAMRALEQDVNNSFPNGVLSPADLADMVVRGHIEKNEAQSEASKSGINASKFDQMVRNAGSPPGPDALAEALRRKFIPLDSGSDTVPGYLQGIAQSRLQTQWSTIITQLDARLPGPSAAVEANIRTMRDAAETLRLYELFGGDPSQFQLEVDLAGAGPTPVEAGVLLNRNIIPPKGTGPASTSFEQAIAESRFKNKWAAAYDALRAYRPPPRTVTAMLREGSIDLPTATQWLKDYGVTDAALPAYLTKAAKTGIQRAHEITEAEIIRLYTEHGIDATKAAALLTSLGYSKDDTDLILAAADLEYQRTLSTATIAAVKQLYLHLHIDKNGAIQRLDTVGIRSTYRDALLELWDLEIEAGVKSLTKKEIVDFATVGLLSQDDATVKLQQAGYSASDAQLIIAFAFGEPPSPSMAGAPAIPG